MFDPTQLDLTALPSVALEARCELPPHQGLYFAVASDSTVLYIGKATNILNRWKVHDRLSEVKQWSGVTVSWLLFDGDLHLLNEIEQACIEHFKPLLNKPMGGLQAKKEGASKRTFRFSDDLIARVARIAGVESRTITAQIEVFLLDKVRQYEKMEKESGDIPVSQPPAPPTVTVISPRRKVGAPKDEG